ncbi:hypothetical protein AB0M47_02865 [Hamadaea sp. NPDC051192]|uniref:hypothetical protein n=1 Tax=Hamadaea sp. NPDC051192 TaxID=3154940 RepID=UPI003443FBA7
MNLLRDSRFGPVDPGFATFRRQARRYILMTITIIKAERIEPTFIHQREDELA